MFDLILIDFSWLYNRYYFIAKTKQVKEEDSLLIELSRMLKQFLQLIEKSYPSAKVLMALDSPTSTLKNKAIYEGYKQNRDKEAKKEVYSILKDVVLYLNKELSNKFIFVKSPEYEADQVIAALSERFHDEHEILIYSGDKDLLQLTALENVFLADKFERGMFLIKTDQEIFDKFKNSKGENFTRISVKKADLVKYRSLKGDPSDNLPPVFPRIKDKEIASIIKDYWVDNMDNIDNTLSIERINDIVDDIRGDNPVLAQKLDEAKENWCRNYRIMSLFGLGCIPVKKVRK